MKIIIFDGSFQTTAFIRRLAEGLQKRHQVFILGFNEKINDRVKGVSYVKIGSNQSNLNLVKTSILQQGLKLSVLKTIIKTNRKQLQEKNLKIILDKIQPDIIHAQWNSVLPWLEPYLENKQYPVVLSQRGYHTNIRPFIQPKNLDYLSAIYSNLGGLHSVSEAISKKGKAIGIPFTKIDKIVYTGLEIDKFKFNKHYSQKKQLEILSVGRPHWVKGYSYALEAMKILKKQGFEFHYTIIGASKNEELTYCIDQMGLEEYVSLKPKMKQQEVFNYMNNSSVLLLPSIEEGLANVVVEAMALGTPVISTHCGGMGELIENNKNGFLVNSRNSNEMADKIRLFSELSLAKITELRFEARQKVESKFTEENMISGMLDLYHQVLSYEKN
tara:strand:- start:7 stop:1164 length:1158 start_codon:yes stop_codon:yes gene_type:complete